MKLETVEDLEAAIERQNLAIEAMLAREARRDAVIHDLGELVRAMDHRLKLLQGLVDNMQGVLIAAGLAAPRPAEDPVVN